MSTERKRNEQTINEFEEHAEELECRIAELNKKLSTEKQMLQFEKTNYELLAEIESL